MLREVCGAHLPPLLPPAVAVASSSGGLQSRVDQLKGLLQRGGGELAVAGGEDARAEARRKPGKVAGTYAGRGAGL